MLRFSVGKIFYHTPPTDGKVIMRPKIKAPYSDTHILYTKKPRYSVNGAFYIHFQSNIYFDSTSSPIASVTKKTVTKKITDVTVLSKRAYFAECETKS